MPKIFKWNGQDLPKEFQSMPAGRYLIESVDHVPSLTPEQEEGLEKAIQSIDQGRGLDNAEAKAAIKLVLKP